MTIDSANYSKLPTIDQARIYLLQKSPKNTSGTQYTNKGLMKTYLKYSLNKLEMDDPIALNNEVIREAELAK